MKQTGISLILWGLGACAVAGMCALAGAGDSHEGHEHEPSNGNVCSDAKLVTVTKEQVARLGIKISLVERGAVNREIRVPGEVTVNSDQVAHVVPRAPGIVRKVEKTVGDHVEGDDVLAWIESESLAQAKLDFYARESEVACCDIELPRAKAIFDNVARLYALLKDNASEEEIRELDGLEMGEYRGKLLTAYAAYRAAETLHEQEAGLRAKGISSAQELLKAETALKRARADFQAALDTARYSTLIAYTEAAQERQVASFNAVAAEKQLRLSGADDGAVSRLRALAPKTAGIEPCLCGNPDCAEGKLPSVTEELGKDTRFAWYALPAPFKGIVAEKHIVTGESVDKATEVYTIADLSSVWVDLAISQDSIPYVREGYAVSIRFPGGATAETEIDFISPMVDRETRTAMARATLENKDGLFRPGTFVEASIHAPSNEEAVVVPKASVQLVNDRPCVFVWSRNAFELREVRTGAVDSRRIEILEGLAAGETIASLNAFHLNAEYIKSAAGERGEHHGHSH